MIKWTSRQWHKQTGTPGSEDGFGSCNSLTIAPVPEGPCLESCQDALWRTCCGLVIFWSHVWSASSHDTTRNPASAPPGDPASEGGALMDCGDADALATARAENESLRQLCCMAALMTSSCGSR